MACLVRAVFLASTLLLFSMRVISHMEESLIHQNSSTEADEQDFRKLLIDDFKSKVLQTLRIPEPPTENFTNHFLSRKMIKLLEKRETKQSGSEPKKDVIVYPINNEFSCQRGNATFCMKFDFNFTLDLESIISVHAYFRKMQLNESLTLKVYDANATEDDPLIRLREDLEKDEDPEWISFELPHKLALEEEGSQIICSVEIEGSEVSVNEGERPFLVITKLIAVDRMRREVENKSSTENCTCCVDNYHITVEDIGWHNWIIAPDGFNLRICRGECRKNFRSYTIGHSSALYLFFKRNTTVPRPACDFLQPRCKAVEYSSTNILSVLKNGSIEISNIKNMIVEKCACLL